MANAKAGEKLQLAIAEGRAKQCTATCKATGTQCQRVAVTGFDVCSVHGAGSIKRVEQGIKKSPGRPIEHGLYSHKMPEEFQEVYEEAFGDLTLIKEAALSKVMLHRFMQKMLEDIGDHTCEVEDGEDGQFSLESVASQPAKKRNAKEDEYYYMRLLDAVVKTVTAAYDQLREKKIVVNLKGTDEEVMERVKTIVGNEMAFLNELICPDCKKKILAAMKDRQTTVME
jgi:hypothetical protein